MMMDGHGEETYQAGGMDDDIFQLYQRRRHLTTIEATKLIDALQETREITRRLWRDGESDRPEDELHLGKDDPLHVQGLPMVYL